jgi:hypothetical protein
MSYRRNPSIDWESVSIGLVAGAFVTAGLGYLLVKNGIAQAQTALNQSLQTASTTPGADSGTTTQTFTPFAGS